MGGGDGWQARGLGWTGTAAAGSFRRVVLLVIPQAGEAQMVEVAPAPLLTIPDAQRRREIERASQREAAERLGERGDW